MEVANVMRDIAAAAHAEVLESEFKMVTFILAGKEYGVDIMAVKEIQKGNRFTYVPNAPFYVRGVYNLRGEIIPVIDLRRFFGLPEYEEREKYEDILILRQADIVVGMIVDSIQKVVSVLTDEIQPAHPLFADVVGLNYIQGVVEKERELYVILDMRVILGGESENDSDDEAEDAIQAIPMPEGITPSATPQATGPAPQATGPAPQAAGATPQAAGPAPQATGPAPQATSPEPQATSPEPQATSPAVQTSGASSDDDGVIVASDSFYESLFEHAHFCPSELNQTWLGQSYEKWAKTHATDVPLDKGGVEYFLENFYSSHANGLWSPEMIEDFCQLLAENEQSITHVWDVASGKGYLAYSVAGGLFLRDKRCKVYATDNNLMAITGAPGLTFDVGDVPEVLRPAMVEGPKGWQFSNDVKNMIIFEYHDIANEHAFPKLDVIIARDVLSFVDEEVFMNFFERIGNQTKQGALLIVGDNEKILDDSEWSPVESKCFSAYRKII